MAHTATPWHRGRKFTIHGDDGKPLGTTATYRPDDECDANAAFIVIAVNAYEEDQRLIRDLRGSLDDAVSLLKSKPSQIGEGAMIHRMEAALTAARGGQ